MTKISTIWNVSFHKTVLLIFVLLKVLCKYAYQCSVVCITCMFWCFPSHLDKWGYFFDPGIHGNCYTWFVAEHTFCILKFLARPGKSPIVSSYFFPWSKLFFCTNVLKEVLPLMSSILPIIIALADYGLVNNNTFQQTVYIVYFCFQQKFTNCLHWKSNNIMKWNLMQNLHQSLLHEVLWSVNVQQYHISEVKLISCLVRSYPGSTQLQNQYQKHRTSRTKLKWSIVCVAFSKHVTDSPENSSNQQHDSGLLVVAFMHT